MRTDQEKLDDEDAACRLEELRVKFHLVEGSPEEIAGTIAIILDSQLEALQAERFRSDELEKALRHVTWRAHADSDWCAGCLRARAFLVPTVQGR